MVNQPTVTPITCRVHALLPLTLITQSFFFPLSIPGASAVAAVSQTVRRHRGRAGLGRALNPGLISVSGGGRRDGSETAPRGPANQQMSEGASQCLGKRREPTGLRKSQPMWGSGIRGREQKWRHDNHLPFSEIDWKYVFEIDPGVFFICSNFCEWIIFFIISC